MKITASVIEDGLGRISIESPIIKDYYGAFEKMIKREVKVSATVERVNSDSLNVDIPMEELGKVVKLCNNFIDKALRHKLKHTEFIPLDGYSVDDLKGDVINANRGKRDFMLVDTFQNYEKHTRDCTFEFNQYPVKYGTSEWTNIFLSLYNKDINDIKKEYQNKLTKQNWY